MNGDPTGSVDQTFVWPQVRTVRYDAPLRWFARGFADLAAAPLVSVFYGVILAAMGYLLTHYYAGAVGLAFTTGFLLVGPFLAIGLYDLSRRRERGQPLRLSPTLMAWRANSPAIGFFALILMLSLAIWMRVSVVVVALFFPDGAPGFDEFIAHLGSSGEAWAFVAIYCTVGAALALCTFATSAVALPLLLDHERMDAISAMISSFNVLRQNRGPMLLWGALVVILTAIGFATWFVGLALVLPMIGHGTWHAYRDTLSANPS